MRTLDRLLLHRNAQRLGGVQAILSTGLFIWGVLKGINPLIAFGIVLGTGNLILLAWPKIKRNHERRPSGHPASAQQIDSVTSHTRQHMPSAPTELGTLEVIKETFERSRRRARELVEAEFVAMIDEGERLRGDAFSSNPQWKDFTDWRDPIAEFVGVALGSTEKQRLLEAGTGQPEVQGHIRQVLEWLRTRRDQPESWQLQIDGHELEAAIAARRSDEQASSLTNQLDSLIREGRKLVGELSAPVQPEKLNWVSKVVGGGPPAGWQEKADAFRQRSFDLLEAQHPALLTDFRDGIKKHFAMEREARERREQEGGTDARSGGEKAVALANHERSGPRREVEACLEGLALARKSI